jgi:hypothetical protein
VILFFYTKDVWGSQNHPATVLSLQSFIEFYNLFLFGLMMTIFMPRFIGVRFSLRMNGFFARVEKRALKIIQFIRK